MGKCGAKLNQSSLKRRFPFEGVNLTLAGLQLIRLFDCKITSHNHGWAGRSVDKPHANNRNKTRTFVWMDFG